MAPDTYLRNAILTLCLILLAVLGVVSVAVSTAPGVGTSPDSAGYIAIARNLASGDGYHGLYGGPATIWAPLYPVMLALVSLVGVDALVVARWLNAVLFGANVLLIGLVLKRSTRRPWLPAFGSVLMLASVDQLHVHSMAWSEPLFIFFCLSSFLFISKYCRRSSAPHLLVAAAAVALAAFTRYAGVTLIAAGLVAIMFFSQQAFRRRLAHAIAFAAIACAPLVLWLVRNLVVAGTLTGRTMRPQPIPWHQVNNGLATVSLWLLPEWVPYPLRAIVVGLAVAAIVFAAVYLTRRAKRPDAAPQGPTLPRLPVVAGTYIAAYFVMLSLSLVFLSGVLGMYIDDRILAPLYPALLVVAVCLLDRLWPPRRQLRIIRALLVVLCAAFALWHANQARCWLQASYGRGFGYTSKQWRQSELMRHVEQLDPAVPIFTNSVEAIYIRTGRRADSLPRTRDAATGGPNEHLAAELEQVGTRLKAERAVIVCFDTMRGQPVVSKDELAAAIPLRVRHEAADGVILESGR
jgi:hypothetical protein